MALDNAHRRSVLVALLAAINCGPTLAQQTSAPSSASSPPEEKEREVSVWLGRAGSDNLSRTSPATRGSYSAIGTLLDLGYRASRIDSHLSTNLELRQYSDDTIDDEPVGTIDGFLRTDLVSERLSWQFQENYAQSQTDAFLAAGPYNRESLNVFSTGPQLDLPLGDRTRLSVGATHSARRYGDSESLDNDARVYELGLFRQTSRTIRFGLALTTNEIEYDLPSVPAYDIDRMSLRYERTFASGGVSIDIGTNELDVLGVATDEPLLNFEWSRELATRSRLRISAARQFSDAGGNLRADMSQAPPGSETSVLLTSSPFEQESLFAAYSLAGTRTSLELSAGTSEESYVGDASLNNDNTTTRISVQRTVTPRLSLGADVTRIEREFAVALSGTAADETDRTANVWVNRSLGRLFSLSLVLTRYERRGSQTFDEDRYELRFGYSPSESATAALGTAGR